MRRRELDAPYMLHRELTPMATAAQIGANRRNSLRSSGPKTGGDKARGMPQCPQTGPAAANRHGMCHPEKSVELPSTPIGE